jgi:hypothetical protein
MLEFLVFLLCLWYKSGQWKNFSNGDITVTSGLLKGYYCTLCTVPLGVLFTIHEHQYSTSYIIYTRAGIFKKSMGARHRVGIGLLYRPARLHRLAEFIPWNRFRGPIHVQKYQLRVLKIWSARNE